MTYTQSILCKEEFSQDTEDGAKEVMISGMCECCFDGLFENDEEDCGEYLADKYDSAW